MTLEMIHFRFFGTELSIPNCSAVLLANSRGVAAATQILEQQRVIKAPQFVVRHPDPSSDMHADPAATDTMPLRLPFGDIQRVTERRDQLGELEIRCH